MSTDTMDLLDVLLMRVLDGEATHDERAKLLKLADAEPRLLEMTELRSRLREALSERASDAPEVVAEVMAALVIDDGWSETADLLRGGLQLGPIDMVEEVMDSLEVGAEPSVRISALHDGELDPAERVALAQTLGREAMTDMTDWADIGRHLREALGAETKTVDLTDTWARVAVRVGVENPEEVPGWEPIADELREALREAARLTAQDEVALTVAVMNSLPRDESVEDAPTEVSVAPDEQASWIRWASSPWMIPVLLVALVAIYQNRGVDPEPEATPERIAAVEDPTFEQAENLVIAAHNQVEMEDLALADEVTAAVYQAEDGAPMFLMIDEGDEEEATL